MRLILPSSAPLRFRGSLLMLLALQGNPEEPERHPWPFAPMDQPARVLSVYHNPMRAELPSAYFHGGVDIHATPGSSVHAIALGRVEVYRQDRFNNIVLTEAHGSTWEYRHIALGSVPQTVFDAARKKYLVQVGDVLGKSDRWGSSGYDHMHLNHRAASGAILDPLDALLPVEDSIPPEIEEILVLANDNCAPFPIGLDPQGAFDTRTLKNGVYALHIGAEDHVGNRSERVLQVRVSNAPGRQSPPAFNVPLSGLVADDYWIVRVGDALRHRFQVSNRTGSVIELGSMKPASSDSGSVSSWTRRTEVGATLGVEVVIPRTDWPGELRTLEYVGLTDSGPLVLRLRLEASRR